MNIPGQAVENLLRFGYTSEEARFIYIVAIHSGYFTHRQFLEFSQTKPGKHSQKFLAKLLAQEHATYHTYSSGGRVYHIFSRKVFGSIERDDLRTRRKHQLEYIKTRLMTLDFVLENLDCHYLETEAEKVPFFDKQFKVDRSLLPSKTYRSHRGSSSTVRYFVDRFPIFLRDPSVTSPVVSFTYVDAGAQTLRGLNTHLESYAGLLRSASRFEFVYLAPTERSFRAAQVEFSRVVLASKGVPLREQVLRYFELRKCWESGERVAAVDVVFLNDAKSELSGAEVEQQYADWRDGRIKDEEIALKSPISTAMIDGKFVPQTCGRSLSVFYRSNGNYVESGDDISADPLSPSFSPETLSREDRNKEDATT